MINIRDEKYEDRASIYRVNELAFGGNVEADIVDALRASGEPIISLVALVEDRIVGHILFSPVVIQSDEASFPAMGLGPMAVLPEAQGKGIGTRLVERGLRECKAKGHDVVIVLGHATYYPRFGFVPSKPYGIRWEQDVPEEVFMVLALEDGALEGKAGIVSYHEVFTVH
jgi:putative acetyltransferase